MYEKFLHILYIHVISKFSIPLLSLYDTYSVDAPLKYLYIIIIGIYMHVAYYEHAINYVHALKSFLSLQIKILEALLTTLNVIIHHVTLDILPS